MKEKDLQKLREKVNELQAKRDLVLNIKREIALLEQDEKVQRYLKLLAILEEKTTKGNKNIDKYTDEKLLFLALKEIGISKDSEIYVYLGTYKYNMETSIVHGSPNILVSRNDPDADYAVYQNLESLHDEIEEIPYKYIPEFEMKHKIIIPKTKVNRKAYFYKLQTLYFETMFSESLDAANEKINKLVKKV